jgi:hypothetical protein
MVGAALRLPISALLFGVALVLLCPQPARAGDLEDFQICRGLYEARDWSRAVSCFEDLVGGETPRLTSTLLRLESRKYLAAAYVFVGRREAGAAQFERLLREDPSYELDAASFPVEVVEIFAYVRTEIREEVRLAEERAAEEARHAYEEARIRALVAFAQEEVETEVENQRWVAAIPFGVGQFSRGDDGLGAFFLVTEGILVASAAVSLGLFTYALDVARQLVAGGARDPDDPAVAEVNRLLLGSEITNWISVSGFAILATAGVIEAQLSFRPTRTVRHRRAVPPELLEGLEISVGLGGFTLRGSF